MTCKDCLYCEKCYSRIRHYMDVDEATGRLIADIEKRCPSFKNKADFVEVVRCKDCKYGEVDDVNFPDQYLCRNIGHDWNNGNHFCSYGERR